MRHRNPFANRKSISARQRRRASAVSPQRQTRAIRYLKANAQRLIAEGLREKIEEREELTPTAVAQTVVEPTRPS